MPRRTLRGSLAFLLVVATVACHRAGGNRAVESTTELPNVLFVVLDDIGLDKLGFYGEVPDGVEPPCTPNLEALAAEGVLFRNVWTNPLCSPTRAQLLTGRHGFRNGVGSLISGFGGSPGLAVEYEMTLPMALTGYSSAAVGKWHLADPIQGLQHPLLAGYEHYAGSMYNPQVPAIDAPTGTPDCSEDYGYYNWIKTWDRFGTRQLVQECWDVYATTDTTDDAVLYARALPQPWFLYTAYNAAHTPPEIPPMELCPGPCSTLYCSPTTSEGREIVNAMIEGVDTEIGRLVAAARERRPDVWIVVIGDNGTEALAAEGQPGSCFGPDRSKGTLYEGGLRVPLIIAGPGVVPGECDALVSSTDIFATLTEIAGTGIVPEDSISLVPYLEGDMTPLRSTVYAEYFSPNQASPASPWTPDFAPEFHARAIRSDRFKLIRATDSGGSEVELFFDLQNDPCEEMDICSRVCDSGLLDPEQAAHLAFLRGELALLGVD